MNDKHLFIEKYFAVYKFLEEARDNYKHCSDAYQAVLDEAKDKAISSANELLQSINNRDVAEHRTKMFAGFAKQFAGGEDNLPFVANEERSPYDDELLKRLFFKMYDKKTATDLYIEAEKQYNYILFEGLNRDDKDDDAQKEANDKVQEEAKAAFDNSIQRMSDAFKEKGLPFIMGNCDIDDNPNFDKKHEFYGSVVMGSADYLFPCLNSAKDESTHINSPVTCSIDLNILGHQVTYAEYNNTNEDIVLNGVAAIISNAITYLREEIDSIIFVDTVRFNETGLGELGEVAGRKDCLLESIPRGIEELKTRLTRLINKKQHENGLATLLFFHNFPHGYDAGAVNLIQQIVANADAFNVCVVLTSNISNNNYSFKDNLEFIRSRATSITLDEEGWSIHLEDYGFEWPFFWLEIDQGLIDSIVKNSLIKNLSVNRSNIYQERVKLAIDVHKKKGTRFLDDNAYSIDKDGNLLYLDFENSNFATFLCGASRSGKSNLLHIIISDLINNNHPDDIEIWLIDFKMTEFSRYIKNLPPHIRYILLDESPELVYDIVDRLTEILNKRQNIFKGKWDKLANVPADKYMPALFVIIDEFSVMSKIIADSLANTNDNYVIKMQTLLAKGAALGMHFIFASQGFTSGARGLNDFAKKQIQQRIAMKTELPEIKATLDLVSYSDKDKLLMEELEVYHSLYKSVKPLNYDGDHLILGKVLYISDNNVQDNFIKDLNGYYKPSVRFEPDNDVSYIYKKPLIVDGNAYSSFEDKKQDLVTYLSTNQHDDKRSIFVGEPRRMMTFYPIDVYDSYQENIAIFSYLNEKPSAASVVLSIAESLTLENVKYKVFSPKGNQLFAVVEDSFNKKGIPSFTDLDDICEELKLIKKSIEKRENLDCYYFIFGIEKLFFDFSFINNGLDSVEEEREEVYEKRQEGEPDLLTMMAMDLDISEEPETKKVKAKGVIKLKKVYDAREDLKFIFTNGPRLGIHFVVPFETIGNLKQMKLDDKLFKHKIFFRSSRNDVTDVLSLRFANDIAELPDHILRYCDNINAVSFRPFLHHGLEIDGRAIDEEGNVLINEEEEYLL